MPSSKDIAASIFQESEMTTEFTSIRSNSGYTIEFKIKTDDWRTNFYHILMKRKGYDQSIYSSRNQLSVA